MQKSSGGAALVETTYRAHLNPETYKPAGLRKKLTNAIPIAECTPASVIQIHAGKKICKFGWRSSSCQQAPSLKEMFFPFANSMTTKFLRLWFWGLHLVCQKSTLSFDMKIMTSCCWPCRALLREDQLKKRRFDVKTAFSMGKKISRRAKMCFILFNIAFMKHLVH